MAGHSTRFFPFYLSLSLLLLALLLARLVAPFQGGLSMEPHVERLVGGVLASPGFWADAGQFALGLLAVHVAFAAALWLASAAPTKLPQVCGANLASKPARTARVTFCISGRRNDASGRPPS